MERLSAKGVLAVAAVGILSLLLGAIADARLSTNPANHAKLINEPLEDSRYACTLRAVQSTGISMRETRAKEGLRKT